MVTLARDRVLRRDIARKMLRPGLDQKLLDRFLREARITAQLEHPNIVPVYDLTVQADGTPTLIMREVRGISLGKAIRAGLLPSIRERLDVLVKVCDAIAFVHSKGVVHRDLKPDNVMVGEAGCRQEASIPAVRPINVSPAARPRSQPSVPPTRDSARSGAGLGGRTPAAAPLAH